MREPPRFQQWGLTSHVVEVLWEKEETCTWFHPWPQRGQMGGLNGRGATGSLTQGAASGHDAVISAVGASGR